TINLPPFGVLYFDPLSKTYKTAQTEPLSLHVAGGPESQSSKSQTQQPPTPQQGEKPSTTPAAPQYEEETTLQSLSQQISPSLALLVLCLTVLSIVAIVVYLRIFQKASGRRKLLIKIEESTSADMLQRAFFLYAAQVLGELDDMNTIRERIREHLAQTDTEENTLYAFELLMDEIDAALYGNRDLSQRIMELRSKALEIAKNLT
ncbi:MAG: BatD family protein, partial [Bdellovibrionales bacterium]|nr:BatD family protein [Bdellovibrionales bacterium]